MKRAIIFGFSVGATILGLRWAWDWLVETAGAPLTDLDEQYDTTVTVYRGTPYLVGDPYLDDLLGSAGS